MRVVLFIDLFSVIPGCFSLVKSFVSLVEFGEVSDRPTKVIVDDG